MKKILNMILVICILIIYFIPMNIVVKAADSYFLKTVDKEYTVKEIASFPSYSDAKIALDNYEKTNPSDEAKVAVIYNASNKMVYATYGLIRFEPGKVIPLYLTASSGTKYTSTHTSYGMDAAFIDYNETNNRVKIRISGFTGWVSLSHVNITPLSAIEGDYIRMTTGVYIRTGPGTTYDKFRLTNSGEVFRYFETKKADGYTWYRINYNNQTAWIANDVAKGWAVPSTGLNTYYTAYDSTGNLLHYFSTEINSNPSRGMTNLGPYPNFMTKGQIYYSFDGNYFYPKVMDMLVDYKNNNFNRAVNSGNPYYPYYLFLPTHTKTGYLAEDFDFIIENKGYERYYDPSITYVTFNEITKSLEWVPGVSRDRISLMYKQGQNFVEVANTYGINALMMFGTAMNESASGTSAIAFYKRNLFGLGAVDSNPVVGAREYGTVRDSIIDFAKFTGSNSSSYSNPTKIYYFGSHYGNKGSGMNVNYATDPYWGEKQANNSFHNDKDFGLQDFQSNTIGITKKLNTKIHKKPDSNSDIIYTLKNNSFSVEKIPVVVSDKIYTIENSQEVGWYKVYTDVALDENQNINNDTIYTFDLSYGYIKEDCLYVTNNQPQIIAEDVVIIEEEPFDYLKGVKAIDAEDDDISGSITYTGEVDNMTIGYYKVVYTATDNNNFSVSKEVNVEVAPSDHAIIRTYDIEIPQHIEFDYLKGVKVTDNTDGDITDKVTYTATVDVNTRGTYNVIYTVTNSKNKVTTKIRTVTVVKNADPFIAANDVIITIGEGFEPLKYAFAYDAEDGDITDKITITSNNVDNSKQGTYIITYQVTDSAYNTVTKIINVTVESQKYTSKPGLFHLEELVFDKTTDKLNFTGFLIVKGINNTVNSNAKYDLILENQITNIEYIIPLDRLTSNVPFKAPNEGSYDYSGSWFRSSIDLSSISQGDYRITVRARVDNYETKKILNNVFFNPKVTRKHTTKLGRGYQLQTNYYNKDIPLELFIRDNGLISNKIPPTNDIMFNQYYSMNFTGYMFNIIGTSHSVKGNYAAKADVQRQLLIVNANTLDIVKTIDVGATTKQPYKISLRVPDGYDKTKAWYNTSIDLRDLDKGTYVIYIKTKSNIEDYGELSDTLFTTINQQTTFNGKTAKLYRNDDKRFRIELIIE